MMKRIVLIVILFILDLFFENDFIEDDVLKAETWFETIWEFFKCILILFIILCIMGWLTGDINASANMIMTPAQKIKYEETERLIETMQKIHEERLASGYYTSNYSPFE